MKISINKKLVGAYVVGALFAMLLLLSSFFTIEGLMETVGKMDELTLRVRKTSELNFHIQDIIKTSDEYLITGDISKRDEFDVLVTETAAIMAVLEGQKGDERWNSMSEKVRADVVRLSELTVEVMFTENPVGNSRAAALMNEVDGLGEGLIEDIRVYNRIAQQDRDNLVRLVLDRAKSSRAIFYIFFPVGSVLLLVLYLYLRLQIQKPLAELYEGEERISRGDFSGSVSVKTGDELEDLADGFNRMAGVIQEREVRLRALLKVIDKVNRELIAASRHKAAFLSNISHELKTPLNHIMGFSELLEVAGPSELSETSRKYAGNIHRAGQELLGLIESLLDVTRVSTGAIAVNLEELNLKDMVNAVVDSRRAGIADRRMKMFVETDGKIESIRADGEMFRQILSNLLDNSLKFTPAGGTIWFRLSEEWEPGGQRMLKVAVEDTGRGIEPEMMDRVFDFFEVGDSSTTRDSGGLGIGLALTKRFVEFHGGSIEVYSEPGRGTKVEFSLPVAEETGQ